MNFEPVTFHDLKDIKSLQPPDWPDIIPYFQFYLNAGFCFPIKCVNNNELLGVGASIVHGRTGWLAHIIVHPSQRNNGIGTKITEKLIDSLRHSGCETLLLVATRLGEAVYKKLDFKKDGDYVFFRDGKIPEAAKSLIVDFKTDYEKELLALDLSVSGETRARVLQPHIHTARLFVRDGKVNGFFMPSLGDGLIIADTPDAGIELLREKLQHTHINILPEANEQANEFLIKNGFTEFRRGIRMWLGKKLHWQPEKIYSRIGGNMG